MTIEYPPRLSLARTPTPLERLERLSEALGVELWVKRDDLTGMALSGNKIRKLEFLLADAQAQGCTAVITTGGAQSNHARATAVAAVRLGLRPYLLLRGAPDTPIQGNLLLDRTVGAKIRFITPEQYTSRDLLMRGWSEELAREGTRAYVVPEGGSDEVGVWGYIRALEEILEQGDGEGVSFDTVVHAAGSGGTSAGLALGARLLKFPGRVLGFAVCDDRAYFQEKAASIISAASSRFDLGVDVSPADLDFDDSFVGRGYALTRPEEVRNLISVARQEGLFLDPVYTNKAFYGMLSLIRASRAALGERVLFIHTGGLFGLFPQADSFVPELE